MSVPHLFLCGCRVEVVQKKRHDDLQERPSHEDDERYEKEGGPVWDGAIGFEEVPNNARAPRVTGDDLSLGFGIWDFGV